MSSISGLDNGVAQLRNMGQIGEAAQGSKPLAWRSAGDARSRGWGGVASVGKLNAHRRPHR